MKIKFVVKNYRCFSDEKPAAFEIGDGFTAFIGPNNVGKSTLLRMFYELREFFAVLSHPEHLLSHLQGRTTATGSRGVSEDLQCFNDRTKRDISIAISVADGSGEYFGRNPLMTATIQRGTNNLTVVPWHRWDAANGPQSQIDLVGRSVVIRGRTIMPNIDVVSEAMRRIAGAQYIPAFRNAINEGAGSYYDLAIGSSFIDAWNSWQNGNSTEAKYAVQRVLDDVEGVFGFERLFASPSVDRKTLQFYIDKRPYVLAELGAGLSQFLIVLANVAFRKPTYLLIDEPELNLHPSLQVDFLTRLASYAENGVIFATHSLGLARSTAQTIYSLRRTASTVECHVLEGTRNYAELAGELCYSGFRELGFNRLLLVEGVTEVKTVTQMLRKYGLEHKVLLMPLGGSAFINGRIEQELDEFNRLNARVSVLIDSERESETASLAKDRAEFVDVCKKLGFDVHVTSLRATENYFTDAAVKAVLGPNYAALGPYDLLRKSATPWHKEANWRIAREMTKADLDATDLGSLFKSLASRE